MIRTLLFTLSILFTLQSTAQSELVFEDNFNDNNNEWRTFYGKIKKGRYDIETIGKDIPVISTLPVKLDQEKNYEITYVVSMEWNKTKDLMGVVWNRSLDGGYFYGFNKEYDFKLYTKDGKETNVLAEGNKPSLIYPMYQKNIISVKKIGKQFEIYVNRMKVHTIDFDENFGDHIGFFVGQGSELRAYTIKVAYID